MKRFAFTFPPDVSPEDEKRAVKLLKKQPGVLGARLRGGLLHASCREGGPEAGVLGEALLREGISVLPAEDSMPGFDFRAPVRWLLALAGVYLTLGALWGLPLPRTFSYPVSAGITQMLLTLAVWALCAEYFRPKNLFSRRNAPDTYAFAILASLCAAVYSVPSLIAGAARMSRGEELRMSLFFDCAALLPVVMTLGRDLERRQRKKLAAILQTPDRSKADEEPPLLVKRAYRAGRILAWAALALAAASAVFWLMKGESAAFAVSCAVCVLALACPGIPGRAASAVLLSALAELHKKGVNIKSMRTLEMLSGIKSAVLEQEGALYGGNKTVEGCALTPDTSERMLFSLAASALQGGEDPVSRAVLARAAFMDIPLDPLVDREGEGANVRALAGETRVLAGDYGFMLKNALDMAAWEDKPAELARDGCTALFVATAGRVKGIIALRDALKPGAKNAVSALKEMGLTVMMASGEKTPVSEELALRAGADSVTYDQDADVTKRLLAAGKEDYLYVRADRAGPMESKTLTADVSGRSDAPVGAAVESIPFAVSFARAAVRRAKKRLWCLAAYEAVCLPLAAGLVHARLGYSLAPLVASPVMLAVNLLMLRGVKWEKRGKSAAR
ncbi:MAG: cation-translocating P-type ATPase [Clostridia bacterium]|nr:cation-translocating P-type ATPase [Clostridia bacterium]MBR5380218.1 cation-translocating P-type ATPase [Clostridia bacterium]